MFDIAKRNSPATLIVLCMLFFGAKYIFMDSMDSFPNYVHAWTQSDRLAIAQNFQENGFDFFHPQTYNLLTKDGVTQVDFPIHDYLAACISSFFKTDLIVTFRWYVLIYSLIGIFFLYQILLLYTRSSVRSIVGAAFIFTIPFLVYYENGFLPSAPSFANFLIGFYCISLSSTLFAKQKTTRYYVLGISFLSLAALARAPFFIFLFAELLRSLWIAYQRKQYSLIRIGIILMGIVCFIAYFLYNQHLAATYGSMFLSEAQNFSSLSDFFEIVSTAIDRWGFQLMSPYHAFLYLALLITSIVQFKKWLIEPKDYSFLSYFIISSIGVLCFFFAFGLQFKDHDYYYIDSFLPLITLSLVFCLGKLKIPKQWYNVVGTISFIFFFYFFSYAKQNQKARYTPPYNDRLEYAYSVYQDSKSDLIDWGLSKEDTLYVIDANSTNIPFIIWGNKGYTNRTTSKKVIEGQLDSNFTYALLVDSFFRSSTYKDYPGIISQLQLQKTNGKISLYKKSTTKDPSLFFKNLIYSGQVNFDEVNNFPNTYNSLSRKAIDSDHQTSLSIESENVFALTVKTIPNKLLYDRAIHVLFNASYFQEDSSAIQIVCKYDKYYSTHYTQTELDSIGSWEDKQFHYVIPPHYFNKEKEIAFYFWNPNQSTLVVDDIHLLIYQ